jgi:hypothetical protein
MSKSDANSTAGVPPGLDYVLNSICGSAGLRRSPRLQRFLRYVVQQSISASERPLKETQIALEVFDRRADFDPQIDPIVRVEAGRLRLRLTEYYAGPGQNDPVLIELNKGSYLPTFRNNPLKSQNLASTSAYRLYLKGRYFWGKRTAGGLAKAGSISKEPSLSITRFRSQSWAPRIATWSPQRLSSLSPPTCWRT